MASTFATETRRSVRGSLGRFLSIMAITALGCGFFAGLRMAGPDMRAAADAWYDGTRLYDLRVVSTLGLDGRDVDDLAAVEGVESAMGSVTLDVLARAGDERRVLRVSSLPVEAARAATSVSDTQVSSDDDSYLNRVRLLEGSWPDGPGECVLEGDKPLPGVGVGDSIEVVSAARDVDDVLVTRTLEVVGLVSSSCYPYTGSFGSTTLGSGAVDVYAYVGEESLVEGCPLTECYLTVEGARDEESEGEAYWDVVGEVAARIEADAPRLAATRLSRLRETTQEQVDEGSAEIDRQRATADGQLSQLEGQVESLSSTVDGLEAQLAASASDPVLAARREALEGRLATARASLERAQAAYDEARATADEQLDAAQERLDRARSELDGLSEGDVYVLDRSQNEGLATYHADSERMDAIASVFPTMFFLVAALVSLTTMTRMVEEERGLIGTHKALGYGKTRICSRYLAYAAAASLAGAAVGVAALTQFLPAVIIRSYAIIYAVPLADLPLPVSGGVALGAAALGVGTTLAATLAAVLASLSEQPARLMRPLAPKPGRRILLERVRPLWHRLSFSWKLTFRNLFRYKRRLLMTVAGVAGCAALLLVGFGLHDAIWDIIANQYGPILHYDTQVGLSDGVGEGGAGEVAGLLDDAAGTSGVVRVHCENQRAEADGLSGEPPLVSVVAPADGDSLAGAVTFRDRASGEPVAFGDDAVLVTEKLAELLGVGAGDEVSLLGIDAVGNATGEGRRLVVTGVVENYVGNCVYVGPGAWRAATGDDPACNALLASTGVTGDDAAALAERLEDLPQVSTVSFSGETVDAYRSMLSVVDFVVVVLVACAAALAAVVLFNLTYINLSERTREIATLKVLGFLPGEVHSYVFREVLLLALLGDAAGMLAGTWLEGFVVRTAEVDYVMFGRAIHPASYAASFALTMAFAVLVLLAMRRRLDDVDMVESLKGVD